jgi:cytochrome c biogenesis protein CcmG/thiol:disulfide interchange protein DsbE
LTTFDGELFSLADQRGKVVIVNFWASWCVPCREEAPILQDVWERYRDRGVVMVGVDYLDVERDALAFIDEFGITYPNGLDMGKAISKRYRIKGVPETFIVDQNGNIVEFYVGAAKEGQLDSILNLAGRIIFQLLQKSTSLHCHIAAMIGRQDEPENHNDYRRH